MSPIKKPFDRFFDNIIAVEGGYVNDKNDSGGETKYGITKKTAVAHGYNGDMVDLPLDVAKGIYRKSYWDSMQLTGLDLSCPALCIKLADMSVNLGVRRAVYFLQRLLNVMNNRQKLYADIKVDGYMGDGTITALRRYLKLRNGNGEAVMIRALNCLQGAFYIALAEDRQKDENFVFGWMLNRVE